MVQYCRHIDQIRADHVDVKCDSTTTIRAICDTDERASHLSVAIDDYSSLVCLMHHIIVAQ